MNKQKDLWEKLAQANSRYYINSDKGKGITEEEFRKSGIEAYKKYIQDDELLRSKDSILDLGCGSGRLTEFMAKDFKKVYGSDISPTMISEARTRLVNVPNVEFLETDGDTIPLSDATCNIVFAYLVFQHIKTREMVEKNFKEIFRILKPGGIFKVLMRSDKQKDMGRWWSGVEYDQESAEKVYEPIGFKLIKTEPVDTASYWLWLTK